MNWHELAETSHYQSAAAVRYELLKGNIQEAVIGIEELTESLSRSDKRALRSQLIRLMAHIIRWKSQPESRSQSWSVTIENTRIDIEEIPELEPSLKASVPNLLKELFQKAKRISEKEMNKKAVISELSWNEVFEDEYGLSSGYLK